MPVMRTTAHPDGTRDIVLAHEPWTTVQAIETAAELGVPIGFEGFGGEKTILTFSVEQDRVDVTTYGDAHHSFLMFDSWTIYVRLK